MVSACKIREDEEIKGRQILGSEFKISQFANDASLILEDDRKSYEKLCRVLREFESILGLKLNDEKTCNVWLGSKRNCAEKLLPYLNMCWNPPEFKIFGVWFTNNLSDMAELNVGDEFIEVKQTLTYGRNVQSLHLEELQY